MIGETSPDAWADKYQAALRPIAIKYGPAVFEFTMAVGMANVAINIVAASARLAPVAKATGSLAQILNFLTEMICKDKEFAAQFAACKAEIEASTPAIMVPESKILLPS